MTDEIHQLTSQLTNAKNLIHQHIETIQQKQSELANRTEENGQEINVLDQKLNSTQENQQELTSRVEDHDRANQERFNQLTTKVTNNTNDIETLERKVQVIQQKQSTLTNKDVALDTKIEQVKQYGHGNNGRINQLTTKVTRNTNNLGTLTQSVRTVQQGQTSSVSRSRALNTKIEQVKQYGHSNRGRIDQLTTKVTRNTNNLGTQMSNVRSLQQGQTTLNSRSRALDGKIEEVKRAFRYTNDIRLRPIDSNWKKVKTVTLFSLLKGIIYILLQGILMVKYNGQWGTVCDDHFGTVDAQSACHTLGFSGGSHTNYNAGISASILMDDVSCSSSTQNFLTCTHIKNHNCVHNEDVLLTCS